MNGLVRLCKSARAILSGVRNVEDAISDISGLKGVCRTTTEPREVIVNGLSVMVDDQLGHLCVYHDGTLCWDELQAIKAQVWGPEARAIEVYPAASAEVNNRNARHLWRAGAFDFLPDLLGEDGHEDSLQARYAAAWAEARR